MTPKGPQSIHGHYQNLFPSHTTLQVKSPEHAPGRR